MSNILRTIFSYFDFSDFFLSDESMENTCDTANIDKYNGEYNSDCDEWEVLTMNRKITRRNSRRFVIGDGDDESTGQLPDVTVSQHFTRIPEGNWMRGDVSKLQVRSTLT
ncbi:hypothetical protein JTB14_000899 [Gonioctena quinquepunctata]|nr:hypothetical protein JTB14_000899 [Gonioctena quinquepunctata]